MPMRTTLTSILLVFSSSLVALPLLHAHHDTEKMIALFSERIQSGEASAELYFRRAIEYRVLRQYAKAEADLQQALKVDPNYTAAHRELAHLLAKKGQNRLAIQSAKQAIHASRDINERSGAMILLARLLAESRQPKLALRHCRDAFELRPSGKVEWYLLHAELLNSLEMDRERQEVLAAGYATTHSIVLRNAWIDALLDAGEHGTAMPIIEKELKESRLKSSWLLRFARAKFATNQRIEARAALQSCLEELTVRIHPERPDISLIAQRGLARALLGKNDDARQDLEQALAAGADQWMTATLKRTLSNAAAIDLP